MKPLSVAQLNSYIKRILSTDPILGNISVIGEISNLVHHRSGHIYFSLKDEASRISCFLSSDRVRNLRYELGDGMQVIVSGRLSVYERGGTYSFHVRELDPAGLGALNAAFENLKLKLQAEGLFDEARKRQLPKQIVRIGVVTSPTGAAIQDIISTVQRRNPLIDIRIFPCLVQGEEAATSIVSAISQANAQGQEIDVLIVGRGGGSIEDLWAFNEEVVARAVASSRIPVISAVGHETDVVMTDYAADIRASTPTAAAEISAQDLSIAIEFLTITSASNLSQKISDIIYLYASQLDEMRCAARKSMNDLLSQIDAKLALDAVRIRLLDPMGILKRGYAAIQSQDEIWIDSITKVLPGDNLSILLHDGRMRCTVMEVEA